MWETKDHGFGEELCKKFLAYQRARGHCALNSEKAYRFDVAQFLGFLWYSQPEQPERGFLSVEQLARAAQPSDIKAFVAWLQAAKNSSATIARKLAVVRSLYKYLLATGQVFYSPAGDIRIPKLPKREARVIAEKTVQALLEAINHQTWLGWRDESAVRLLASTGMRIKELVALDRSDVLLDKAAVRIRRGSRVLEVPLSAGAVESIVRYLRLRDEALLNKPACAALLVNKAGGRLSSRGLRRRLSRISALTGMSPITPRDLRSFFTVTMLRKGAPLDEIRRVLGHVNKRTIRAYLKVVHSVHNN